MAKWLTIISNTFKDIGSRLNARHMVLIGLVLLIVSGVSFAFGRVDLSNVRGGHNSNVATELYQCPMHPTYVSDSNGDCPICGMSLVKVEQDESYSNDGALNSGIEGHAPIRLVRERQQLIGVTTDVVRVRELKRTINTVGWIAYDPDLYHAQEEYLAALEGKEKIGESAILAIRERSEKLVESSRLRLRLLGLNDEQIDRLTKETGPDSRLLLADALDSVWLYGTIYEFELQLVKEGDPVDIDIKAFPGEKFSGTVQSIDTVLDPITRSVRVRVIIPNTEGKLKPQMFANARIHVSLGSQLSIPDGAVIDTGTRKIVYVDQGEGRLVPREVTLGHKAEGYYAVVSGLEEDQRVVTSGNFLIDSESQLRAATQAAAKSHKH